MRARGGHVAGWAVDRGDHAGSSGPGARLTVPRVSRTRVPHRGGQIRHALGVAVGARPCDSVSAMNRRDDSWDAWRGVSTLNSSARGSERSGSLARELAAPRSIGARVVDRLGEKRRHGLPFVALMRCRRMDSTALSAHACRRPTPSAGHRCAWTPSPSIRGVSRRSLAASFAAMPRQDVEETDARLVGRVQAFRGPPRAVRDSAVTPGTSMACPGKRRRRAARRRSPGVPWAP